MSRLKRLFVWTETEGPFALTLELYAWGRDFVLTLGGGEAHLGAISVSENSQFHAFSLGEHKEGPLTQLAAQRLRPFLTGELLVFSGIHYPNLHPSEVQTLVRLAEALVERAVLSLSKG